MNNGGINHWHDHEHQHPRERWDDPMVAIPGRHTSVAAGADAFQQRLDRTQQELESILKIRMGEGRGWKDELSQFVDMQDDWERDVFAREAVSLQELSDYAGHELERKLDAPRRVGGTRPIAPDMTESEIRNRTNAFLVLSHISDTASADTHTVPDVYRMIEESDAIRYSLQSNDTYSHRQVYDAATAAGGTIEQYIAHQLEDGGWGVGEATYEDYPKWNRKDQREKMLRFYLDQVNRKYAGALRQAEQRKFQAELSSRVDASLERLATTAFQERNITTAFHKPLLTSPIAEYALGNVDLRLTEDGTTDAGRTQNLYVQDFRRGKPLSVHGQSVASASGSTNYLILGTEPPALKEASQIDLRKNRVHSFVLCDSHPHWQSLQYEQARFTILNFLDQRGKSFLLGKTRYTDQLPHSLS